jgi:hypothetical protein
MSALLLLSAAAHHRARLDPTEPLFTERSFLERNLELDTEWEHRADGNSVELTPSFTWVFWKRLQFDLDIPVDIAVPEHGATIGRLDDVTLATQALLCCQPDRLLDYLSLRLAVEAPTGDRARGIGGTGSYAFSVLPGRLQTITQSLPDLFVQAELAYQEAMRPEAGAASRSREVDWNVALAQQYLAGRVRPVLEMLGTSTVGGDDQGTVVALAAGMWTAPFPDEHWLSPVSIGMGWQWPVTGGADVELTGLFIVEWAFDA